MKRFAALILSMALLLSLCPEAGAANRRKRKEPEPEPEPERVEINSLEQFLSFADECTETSYSENKIFLLNCNINLAGTDFTAVPYLAGGFEGNGHRISGLNIDKGGSRQGLFRIIAETAWVKDLSIYGSVCPTGTGISVGGVAGVNFGSISGCSFEGTVTAKENVGGIAGISGEKASVTNCRVSGSVTGEHCIGGICGLSLGTVSDCSSSALVNTVSVIPEDSPGINLSELDLANVAVDDFLDITDLGGICGKSSGTVKNCTNSGDVGYHNTGYNVGGICGTTSGYITCCSNTGTILARKDAGGIAGQLIPYVRTDLSEGKFDDIEASIKKLNGSIAAASSQAGSSNGQINGELSSISGYAKDVEDQLRSILDQLDDQDKDIGNHIHVDPDTGEVTYDGGTDVDTTSLINSVSALYSEYEKLMGMVNKAAGELAASLVNVAYSISGVMGQLNNVLNNANIDIDEYEVSVDEGYQHDTGAIDGCVNRGDVIAESCAGGIAGNVAYELRFDSEDIIDASHYIVSEVKRYIFAVIRGSESYGRIETRQDFAGGIAGTMSLGAILDSTGAGYVTSDNGGYVGGLAGRCEGTVKDSCARPVLSGDGYVGGLVGYGEDIINCCVYAAFESYGEYAGAIAGWAEGSVKDNLFVSCRPAGIDGISYTGKMQSVSYEELLQRENLPEVFREIKVRFIGPGGKIIREDKVEFGGSVTDYPEVPLDGVRCWVWESDGLTDIYHSTDVFGDYYNPASTLSTGEDVPMFLVEGTFYDGMELTVEETVNDSAEGPVSCWRVYVTGYQGELTVRMFAEETGRVYVYGMDGTRREVSASTDGRYKVFKMQNGESVSYEVIPVKVIAAGLIAGISAGAVALIAAVIILRKKKKRRQGATETEESGDAAETEDLELPEQGAEESETGAPEQTPESPEAETEESEDSEKSEEKPEEENRE